MIRMGKRYLIGVLLSFCYQAANADMSSEVYVERDDSGAVRFTDQPETTDAETWRLATPVEIALLANEAAQPEALESLAAPRVEILSPKDDEAIRSNHGEVDVLILISGQEGVSFICELTLDGEPVDKRADADGAFVLQNIDRGTHLLQVRLMDAEGSVLAKSSEVRFHMLRHTITRR